MKTTIDTPKQEGRKEGRKCYVCTHACVKICHASKANSLDARVDNYKKG
jgi:hypothetical protein